ncbi:MAG: RNA polymerase sigma factor (sigma-70 family), partial [Bradymonadia bacterium]
RAYDGQRPLQAYVGVIARRAAKDVVRNASAQKRGGGMIHDELPTESMLKGCGVTPSDAVEARDLLDGLVAHLDTELQGRGRLVMRCLYTDGRTVEETAELLGATRNAVAIWQTKIRKRARIWLDSQ